MKTGAKNKELVLANLSNVIKEIRESRGLTQKEFAKQLGVDANYISMVERGDRSPSLSLLTDISDAFNVKLHQIFLQAEMPELGGNYRRAYDLAKILSEVDFDKLHKLANGLADDWNLEPEETDKELSKEGTLGDAN